MKTIDQKIKTWTYNDFNLLPTETNCEILNGELSISPAPIYEHQRVSIEIEFLLKQFLKNKPVGVISHAPVDVILNEENVVQPDILFISDKNKSIIQAKGIEGVPDLIIEIVSPSSIIRDRKEKMELYFQFKVEEYWIVDVANKSVEIYIIENNKYQPYSFASEKGLVKSKIIEGFELNVEEVF